MAYSTVRSSTLDEGLGGGIEVQNSIGPVSPTQRVYHPMELEYWPTWTLEYYYAVSAPTFYARMIRRPPEDREGIS